MKRTDGFDARRLRPREQRSLGSRIGSIFGLLLVLLGVFLAFIGAASLLGSHEALASIAVAAEVAATSLALGLILIWTGLMIRRRIRRRLGAPSDLSLSPRLRNRRN